MASRKKSRSKQGKSKTKAKPVKVSAKKNVHSLIPRAASSSHLHSIRPLSEHIVKLLIPTNAPLPLSPTSNSSSSVSASSAPISSSANALTDEQTWQLLSLGQKCYSILGQTRLFWSQLKSPLADQEWLRFHFLQSSMLSTFFLFLYAIFGAAVLFNLLNMSLVPFGIAELGLLLSIALHLIIFSILGKKASRGEVVMIPLIGPHAAMLAASNKPLQEWKL